jgi:protein-S-isoprenylcysteine O-methyltransferase Ste14
MSTAQTSNPTLDVATGRGRLRLLWEMAGNVALSLFFLQFLLVHGQQFLITHRISTLLLVIKVATDVVFYLIRRMPKEISISPYDWGVGLLGTYMVAFFRPEAAGSDLLAAQALQTLGMLLQVAGMLSLNTSIGITAANRGVKTGGMYRLVRHPLYLSYVLAYGGYLLNQLSWHNAMIYTAAVLLWVLRLMAEERLLMRDETYRSYAQRVRWRLIPLVF